MRLSRCVHALVVLGPRVDAASLGSMLGLVQERIVWLGSRPYLPPGLPLRTLTLLNALLQVQTPLTPSELSTCAGANLYTLSFPLV